MRRAVPVKLVIGLMCLGMLALHCADPNLPRFRVITPAQNTVFLIDHDIPLPTYVEAGVAQPGCGATIFPIDPETFTATLRQVRDGEGIAEEDVTDSFGEPVLNPTTGEFVFPGTVDLPGFGDWNIEFNVSNEVGEGTGILTLFVKQNVEAFQGGPYKMTVSSLGQAPANCLLPGFLLPIIQGIVGGTYFTVFLPSGEDILNAGNDYPFVIPLPYPLGNIDVILSVDVEQNAILIDGPDDYVIDLTGLAPLPGFDCVITAAANGIFDDLDPYDPDGFITISIADVQASPGGSCTLVPPSGACDLIVGIDGDLIF